ncbi:MAG: MipA/OmpV family protein [Sneathiellales bacterium]|nr:MipA/OmpV family protein [Sneathiellales bacterium]
MSSQVVRRYRWALLMPLSFSVITSVNAEEKKDWEINLGLGAFVSPAYEGSDETEVMPFPLVDITWKERVFLNPGDGLGVHLYNKNDLTVSASIGYEMGRQEDDSNALKGLGDIDDAASANFSVEYDLGPVSPYLDVSKHLGGTDGTLVEIGIQSRVPFASLMGKTPGQFENGSPKGLMFHMGLSTTWADDNYMKDYFGINNRQAASSGYSRYSAGAGFKSADLEFGARYPFSENWAINAQIGYSRLLEDAADSPIVKEEDQFSGGIFLSYSF